MHRGLKEEIHNSFKENCVKHWNYLSRDIMESSFLKTFEIAAAADGHLLKSLNVWLCESERQSLRFAVVEFSYPEFIKNSLGSYWEITVLKKIIP